MTTTTTQRRQGVNAGLGIKAPVKAATTANITLSGEQTIDGVACVSGDRVLVKNQTNAVNNGIYVCDTSAWDRDYDFDGTFDVKEGTMVQVNDGSANASSVWRVSTPDPITIGSSSLSFERSLISDSSSVSFLQAGSGAVETTLQDYLRLQKIVLGWIPVALWSTVADGTNTTALTTYIQSALDDSAGYALHFPKGTYLVGSAGTVTYRAVAHRYCLKIPSNTTLVFEGGATIKLADAQNAHVFTNSLIAGAGDSNIALLGPGIIDCNQANQTNPATGEQSGGLFYNVNRLIIENMKYTNVREYALRITGITFGRFVGLHCTDSDGSGFAFGVDVAGHEMTQCFFDDILAENCAGSFGGAGAAGNGFIFMGDYCQAGKITLKSCEFGGKIQDTSSYCTFGALIAQSSGTQGWKLTGTNSGARVNNITIERVITTDSDQSGFYLEHASDCSIGLVTSNADDTDGTDPAVHIGEGARNSIGQIVCQGAGSAGVNFRTDTTYLNVGQIISRNSCAVTAGQSNVAWQGDNITVGQIISIRDSGTVHNGLDIQAGAANGYLGSLKVSGTFSSVTHIVSSATTLIGDVQVEGSRVATITANDINPDVTLQYPIYKTANTVPTTINALDVGVPGQKLHLIINDANTTIDFTGTNLKGNAGADWSPTTGDSMDAVYDGTNWYCRISDNTA